MAASDGEAPVGPATSDADAAHDAEREASERRYVSRGGLKLESALAASGVETAGRRAIDVGASTGGFTDCLLRHGARRVIAVDVGYGQFDWGLRNDPRVHLLERTNARGLTPELLPYGPDLAVIDVSFISLAKILPALLACLAQAHDILALVKPQFEVGRERVGKGGVVRSAEHRRSALISVAGVARDLGEVALGLYPAGLPGPKGNRETFIWLAEGGRHGALSAERLDATALAVEPDGDGAGEHARRGTRRV
jgi:23S rRNA (cytidine1920-2'-O)/16S rRNA (cytidine1409-2'-O)-methyltransferase